MHQRLPRLELSQAACTSDYMLPRDVFFDDPVTLTTWPDGTPRKRARSERVYRPANKREWRSVYWILERVPQTELSKPTDIIIELDTGHKLRYRKHARKQYSFSSTKYGDDSARRKAEAILQFIDLTGLLPPLSSITATTSASRQPAETALDKLAARTLAPTRKSAAKRYRRAARLTASQEPNVAVSELTAEQLPNSWPLAAAPQDWLADSASEPLQPFPVVPAYRLGEADRVVGESSSSESVNMDYMMSVWRGADYALLRHDTTATAASSHLSTSSETMVPSPGGGGGVVDPSGQLWRLGLVCGL